MPTPKADLTEHLARSREITVSVIGRTSGKEFSFPVWFVLEGKKLYLLPVQGSETQWYKNVLHHPWIRVSTRGASSEFRVAPTSDAKTVSSIVERFRDKYGAKEVKKYYSRFDVAVALQLG